MIVQANQTLLDLAIMGTGTIESIFQIANANGKSITDIPVAGADYIIPADAFTDINTKTYLTNNKVSIGTRDVPFSVGIGYWAVEIDFVVS